MSDTVTMSGEQIRSFLNANRIPFGVDDFDHNETYDIPVVPDIDTTIYDMVKADLRGFSMNNWHGTLFDNQHVPCGTTHCRAGWAITLAGHQGWFLEERTDAWVAGALIYHVSRPGKPIPDFFCTTEDALKDLRECVQGKCRLKTIKESSDG